MVFDENKGWAIKIKHISNETLVMADENKSWIMKMRDDWWKWKMSDQKEILVIKIIDKRPK